MPTPNLRAKCVIVPSNHYPNQFCFELHELNMTQLYCAVRGAAANDNREVYTDQVNQRDKQFIGLIVHRRIVGMGIKY